MDEARAMSHEALESVRLLTDVERKLQSPSLRQLLQRIRSSAVCAIHRAMD